MVEDIVAMVMLISVFLFSDVFLIRNKIMRISFTNILARYFLYVVLLKKALFHIFRLLDVRRVNSTN